MVSPNGVKQDPSLAICIFILSPPSAPAPSWSDRFRDRQNTLSWSCEGTELTKRTPTGGQADLKGGGVRRCTSARGFPSAIPNAEERVFMCQWAGGWMGAGDSLYRNVKNMSFLF